VTEEIGFTLNQLLARARIAWHGVALEGPDWSEHSHSLAFTLRTLHARFLFHGIFNAYWEPLTFALPPVPSAEPSWRRCIDTALPSPDDIARWEDASIVTHPAYLAQARSTVLLARRLGPSAALPQGANHG